MTEQLATLEFDCWQYGEDELLIFSYYMLQDFDIVNKWKVEEATLQRYERKHEKDFF